MLRRIARRMAIAAGADRGYEGPGSIAVSATEVLVKSKGTAMIPIAATARANLDSNGIDTPCLILVRL
jgi:hypothetical protein